MLHTSYNRARTAGRVRWLLSVWTTDIVIPRLQSPLSAPSPQNAGGGTAGESQEAGNSVKRGGQWGSSRRNSAANALPLQQSVQPKRSAAPMASPFAGADLPNFEDTAPAAVAANLGARPKRAASMPAADLAGVSLSLAASSDLYARCASFTRPVGWICSLSSVCWVRRCACPACTASIA